MAVWFIPVLKAILPHIGAIVSAAKPVFTGKNAGTSPSHDPLLQQQIAELQSAVSQNAEHIKELAATLQTTVAALEQAAAAVEKQPKRIFHWVLAASVLSLVSLGIALFALFGR
jgi:methyl-accepting chemotaxis protein